MTRAATTGPAVTGAPSLGALAERARGLVGRAAPARAVLGITGPPGAGKTTLAQALVGHLNAGGAGSGTGPRAAHVPMDGFHLADVELDRLGRRRRKGAPDTFDPGGYLALLQRLRTARETVWPPAFDRTIEQPIAGSIPVATDVQLIVSEGNYLLLDEPGWRPGREVFSEVWFCSGDSVLRLDRLIARHRRFGKSLSEATRWIEQVDQRNAALVERTRDSADLVITGDVAV